MLTLPVAIVPILAPFATLFTNPTWRKAQLLLVGAILTPGQRTVAATLRVMGRRDQDDFSRYHEVLNRAVWSPRAAARILLLLLLQYLDCGDGPLVFGVRLLTNRETLERRRGARISARGVYRDAVRSSRHQLVKASGRDCSQIWDLPDVVGQCPLGGTALGPPGAHRVGAFVAALPTTRTPAQEAHRLSPADGHAVASLAAPVPLGAGGRQRLRRAGFAPLLPVPPRASHPHRSFAFGRRPLCSSVPPSTGQNGRPPLKGPRRPSLKTILDQDHVPWTVAAVSGYDGATRSVGLTSQIAVWYRSGKPPVTIRWVLIRDPQGVFDPQTLLCTDPSADPTQILEWFVLRWQLEVTFQEVRFHLGMETQRQWSDLAIARTTPVLLGLFSWTTLAAHSLQKQHSMTQRTAAWYDKPSPTLVDAIALARRHLWLASEGFELSAGDPDVRELTATLYHRMVDSLAYAP